MRKPPVNSFGQGLANSTGEILSPREPGKQGSDPQSAGGGDPLGRALFEFKGKTYLATFPARDPNDVEFVDLDDLPHFVGGCQDAHRYRQGPIGSEGH